MATVKAKFRPSTVTGRPGTIVILVTHRRIVRQITTGYKVFPYEWDEKQSIPLITGNHERTYIIQSIIQELRKDIGRLNRIIEKFSRSNYGYSCDDIIIEFRRIGNGNSLFYVHGECNRTVTSVKTFWNSQELLRYIE